MYLLLLPLSTTIFTSLCNKCTVNMPCLSCCFCFVVELLWKVLLKYWLTVRGSRLGLLKAPSKTFSAWQPQATTVTHQWQGWFLLLNCCTLILFVLTRVAKHTHRTFFECLIALFFSLPYVNCVIAQSFEVRRTTIFQLQFAFYAWRRRQSQSFPFFIVTAAALPAESAAIAVAARTPHFSTVSFSLAQFGCVSCA